jgi:hypothetical protein
VLSSVDGIYFKNEKFLQITCDTLTFYPRACRPLKVYCLLFTREYTQCTAGYTFCFVVVGVGVVGATFSQTWQYFSQQLMKHDWT